MIRSWVASARGRMPWSTPSCITATRSDKPRSSGISLEIRRMTAEIILKAVGRIGRFISSHRRPFIAKIYRDGRVEKLQFE